MKKQKTLGLHLAPAMLHGQVLGPTAQAQGLVERLGGQLAYFLAIVTVSRLRPLARRRLRIARPCRVFMRLRNPCVRFRRLLWG